MKSVVEDRLISAEEVSRLIALDVKTIYEGGCKTDTLLRIRLGKRRIAFSYLDCLEWIADRKREAQEESARLIETKREASKVVLLRPSVLTRQTINRVLQAQHTSENRRTK